MISKFEVTKGTPEDEQSQLRKQRESTVGAFANQGVGELNKFQMGDKL